MPSSPSIRGRAESSPSSARMSWRATRCSARYWTGSLGGVVFDRVPGPLRVVIAEDDVLFREGIARLLADAGFDVVGRAGDAQDFVRKALAHRPDVAVVDIQMPPGEGADGMRAALEVRTRLPQ